MFSMILIWDFVPLGLNSCRVCHLVKLLVLDLVILAFGHEEFIP